MEGKNLGGQTVCLFVYSFRHGLTKRLRGKKAPRRNTRIRDWIRSGKGGRGGKESGTVAEAEDLLWDI